MVHGKSKKASHKSKKILKVPEGEWIRDENTHEPIIEKDICMRFSKKSQYENAPLLKNHTNIADF
jgi:hypothetical protein